MKKIIAAVLLALLAFSVCTAAFAATDVLITGSDDLIIHLIDTTLASFDFGNGESYGLQCQIVIENRYDHPISFRAYNCYVDGVATTMATPAKTDAGVWEKRFTFMPDDGQDPAYLFSADTITFDLDVENFKTEEVLYTEHVKIEGGLPGLENIALPEGMEPGNQAFEPCIDAGMLLVAEHDDFKLYFAGWENNIYDDSASLYFYPLIENWTDREIDVRLDDVKFDLADVGGSSCFDVPPGDYTDDYFLFFEDNAGMDNPLVNPDWITFNVVVKDSDTRDLIAEIPVSMSSEWLDQIPDEYPWKEDNYPDYTYEDDYCPDYTYEDDYYPDYTYEDESECHLQFFEGADGRWEYYGEGMMDIRVQLRNTSPSKTVKNFELHMYGVEPDGDRLPGENRYYYQSTSKRIGPGETAYCDNFHIFGQTMEKVYFAVSYVEYTDGSVEIVQEDDMDYWYWVLN